MTKSIFIPLISLLGLLYLIGCKDRESVIPKSSLECLIKDKFGGPLDSVNCNLVSGKDVFSGTTDANGRFKVKIIQVGIYSMVCSKENYITWNEEIEVKSDPTLVELTLVSGRTFLRTSDSVLNINHSAGSKFIQVESNSSWSVNSLMSWIKCSTPLGSGNSSVRISWEESSEDGERSAHVIFKAGSIQQKLRLTQSPPLKLISTKSIIGNYENNVLDSIKVVFSKPVSINSIRAINSNCVSEIKYKVINNCVSFSFGCAKLGESYPFSVSVNDGSETYVFNIDGIFYDKKITVAGSMMNYFIMDDNETIWGYTHRPVRLYKISISNLTVTTEFDLDFGPSRIRWNKFKRKINLFKNASLCEFDDIVAGACDNNLIYFNPDNLELHRSRIGLISGYDGDSYGYPYVFPRDLCLFENGTGIILLENEYNYTNIRFIDSFNHDSTYVSNDHGDYEAMYLNYDNTKILMMGTSGSTDIDIFESGQTKPSTYMSPVLGRLNFLIPNKKINRIYYAQLYEQFISDLNDYVSKVSYIDTRELTGADFSYKEGEEETIYCIADGLFEILDYKIGFTTFSTYTDLVNIHTTSDGIYLVALKRNYEGTTDLFVFNIDEMTVNKIPRPDAGGRIETILGSTKSRWLK